MLADTHCHLDYSCFDADRDEVMRRALAGGVKFIIDVGSSLNASRKAVELADNYESIFASAGIHPHDVLDLTRKDITELELLAQHKKVVAVGEIGLDYYDHNNPAHEISRKTKLIQQETLIKLLDLVKKIKLPVIFHCRQAGEDLLSIIQDMLTIPVPGVVHCFSQDKNFLDKCIETGLYVSFTANITYPKSQSLRELVAYAPLDKMLLETDAPFLAPQVLRGKRNEPGNVQLLAEEVARIKKTDFETVAAITTRNAEELFKIDI